MNYLCKLVSLYLLLVYFPIEINAQTPTEQAKEEFENNLIEFMSRERELTRFAFRIRVASEKIEDSHDTLWASEGFVAVDRISKTVRHDFDGELNLAFRNAEGEIVGFSNSREKYRIIFQEGKRNFINRMKIKTDPVSDKEEVNFATSGHVKTRINLLDQATHLGNPFYITFGRMASSEGISGWKSFFDDIPDISPDRIKAAWNKDGKCVGSLVGDVADQGDAFVLTFAPGGKGIVEAFDYYVFPPSDSVDVPESKFKPYHSGKYKWKELPGIGWRPVEAHDVINGLSKRSIKTTITWPSREMTDKIFEVDDVATALEKPTVLSSLFEDQK